MDAELLFTVWSIVEINKMLVSGSIQEECLQLLTSIVLALIRTV